VDVMTTSEPGQSGSGAPAAGDALAERLRAAQRLLCEPSIDPDVRLRLQLRYAAICTSLKLPAADRERAAQRLDRLIADAKRLTGPADSG
jgi:hypothetical protein